MRGVSAGAVWSGSSAGAASSDSPAGSAGRCSTRTGWRKMPSSSVGSSGSAAAGSLPENAMASTPANTINPNALPSPHRRRACLFALFMITAPSCVIPFYTN